MSLYIPSGSKGMSLEMAIFNHTSGYASLPMLVQNDGIYTNFSSGPSKLVSFDGADKWVNLHNDLKIVLDEYDTEISLLKG